MRLIDADELIRKTAEAYFEAMEDETLSAYVLDGMNIVRVAVANTVQKAPTISLDINEFAEKIEEGQAYYNKLAEPIEGDRDFYTGKSLALGEALEILKECIVRTTEENESIAQVVDKE